MTKEELEKYAEEKAKKRTKGFKCQDNCEKSYVMGALDFAEPREKRIAELENENKVLTQNLEDSEIIIAGLKAQIENYKLSENEAKEIIAELQAQIEKMKCCENCKYYNNHYNEVVCKRQVINCKRILRQATRDQWEIKEND